MDYRRTCLWLLVFTVVVGLTWACVMSSDRTLRLTGLVFFLLFWAVGAVMGIAKHFRYRREATSSCRGFAALVCGVHEGQWAVRFSHRNTPARLEVEPPETVSGRVQIGFRSVRTASGPRWGVARLVVDLPRPLPSLYVLPRPGPVGQLEYWLTPGGLPRLKMDNPLFDDRFTVATEDADLAHRLLTLDVQQQLALFHEPVGLHTDGQHVVIELQLARVPSATKLKAFYDWAGRLFDLLSAALGGHASAAVERQLRPPGSATPPPPGQGQTDRVRETVGRAIPEERSGPPP